MGRHHCSLISGDAGGLVHSDLVDVGFNMNVGVGKVSARGPRNSCSYGDLKGVVDSPLRISAIRRFRLISRDVGGLMRTDLDGVDSDMRYGGDRVVAPDSMYSRSYGNFRGRISIVETPIGSVCCGSDISQ